MSDVLINEDVLCSINCYKNIKKSTTMVNLFTNIVTGGVAGGVANNFKLILTPKNLYIQAIEHVAWGGLSEVSYTDKILRRDIGLFEVKDQEGKEVITITTRDNKEKNFIRDNEKKDDLALIMAAIISGN